MELEIINKLFLELSQFATAKTKRELELEKEIKKLKQPKYIFLEDHKDDTIIS